MCSRTRDCSWSSRGVYGGARVREPSTTVVADYLGLLFHYHGASIGDIVRTRVLIQFEAARRFAERASDADLEALEQVLDSEAALFGDQLAFRSRSLTFQLELTDRCGDAVLMVLGQVLDHIQRTIMNHIAASLHPELPTAEIPTTASGWSQSYGPVLPTLLPTSGEPTKSSGPYISLILPTTTTTTSGIQRERSGGPAKSKPSSELHAPLQGSGTPSTSLTNRRTDGRTAWPRRAGDRRWSRDWQVDGPPAS